MKILISLFIALSSSAVLACPTFTLDTINNCSKQGDARFMFGFFKVYDATLYAPNGDYQTEQPFALSLTYLRDFKGSMIAKKSLEEMAKQGSTKEHWRSGLEQLFPNVSKGDTLTGVMQLDKTAQFYKNDALIGTVKDTELATRFFDIWLGENTSDVDFTNRLLNQN